MVQVLADGRSMRRGNIIRTREFDAWKIYVSNTSNSRGCPVEKMFQDDVGYGKWTGEREAHYTSNQYPNGSGNGNKLQTLKVIMQSQPAGW